MSQEDRVSIPDERYAPKPENRPDYKPEIQNFAGHKETCKKVLTWAKDYLDYFKSQSQRSRFEDDMDTADELYRVAKTRSQHKSDGVSNTEDTRSQVTPASFNSDIRIITAGQKAVVLGNEGDVPMEYAPLPDAMEYTAIEGRRIAEDQQAVLAYTWVKDGMRKKVGRLLNRVNKYGTYVIEMGWKYEVDTRKERVVTEWEESEDGETRKPKAFDFKERDVIVADHPTLELVDPKDAWWDTQIENEQDWNCYVRRKQMQLGDIWKLQRTGDFMNVGKLKVGNLYSGEGDSDVLHDRQVNAAEQGDTDKQTGMVDVYEFKIRVPVNPETGRWQPKSILPEWFEFTIAGDPGKDPVFLKLSPNPQFCRKIPVQVVHSHPDDDKGSIKMGYIHLVKCLIAEEATVINQYFDNNTTRNQKPLIAERGSLSIRDKTFAAGGTRIWWKKPGSQDPHEMDIQDTTQQTLPMLGLIDEKRRAAMGTYPTLVGQPSGARTSASEATIDFEQAIKPALEDAKDLADQPLPFISYWVAEMWREFGDPRRRLVITNQNEQREVKPAELWGPLTTVVTSVKRFQDGLIRQRAENQFLNQVFPLAQPYMEPDLVVRIFKQILKSRHFEDVDTGWKVGDDFDAKHVAEWENESILHDAVLDFPSQEENHTAHLRYHKPMLQIYLVRVPAEEQNAEGVGMMKQHILVHEQMQAQSERATSLSVQNAAARQGGGAPPETPGQEQGDVLGAEAGAAENLGLPQQGAPTLSAPALAG